ncbi:MAG: LPS export ABC transporter permease LptG [Enterovibrio sp.]
MFKILDLYIGRTIIATTSICLATLVGLSAIIKFVEQLRSVGEGFFTTATALQYVLLTMPRDLEMFFPMAVLLGALIGLGSLASSSELVVMQAAGFSKLNIGGSVLKTAIPLMLIVLVLGEWGAPQAQKYAKETRAYAKSGGSMLTALHGVWAKDGNDFIYINRSDLSGDLSGITIWRFDGEQNLRAQIFAKAAEHVKGDEWQLNDVLMLNFVEEAALSQINQETMIWHTTLTPEKLTMVTTDPDELSLSGVYDYVQYLKASEQDASRYELAFWRKVLQPISIAVMMLLALSFIFGPLRSVTMGARVLSGAVFGFAFHIANEVFGPMALVYHLPPLIGALVPSAVFIFLTLYLLRRKL